MIFPFSTGINLSNFISVNLLFTLISHTMKNLIKTSAFLTMLLVLFSCSKTIRTQDQVLNAYQTAQDVNKKFGPPTEKQTAETMDIWLYKYNGHSPSQQQLNTSTVNVTELTNY